MRQRALLPLELRGTCDSQYADLRCTGIEQRTCQLITGCAGCNNVVNDQRVAIANLFPNDERVFQIPAPFLRTQSRLRAGCLDPHGRLNNRQLRRSPQGATQFVGLVETSGDVTPSMQWHGNQRVALSEVSAQDGQQ